MIDLKSYITDADLETLVRCAKREDMGEPSRDVTSEMFIGASRQGEAVFRVRRGGRLCGNALLPKIAEVYDPSLRLDQMLPDGATLPPNDPIARVTGCMRSILAFERVALNFLTHLSGIATFTDQFVQAAGRPIIYDTRKTIPGLRGLAKYAVACGNGKNHRIGLYDAILVKDNHLAHLPDDHLAKVIAQVRQANNATLQFIEVEVDTLEQLKQVLPCGPDLVLLDNMDTDTLCLAVAIRNEQAPTVELEASGGVDMTTVAQISRTGVDRIAIGAITHSAPALDIGLDIDPS